MRNLDLKKLLAVTLLAAMSFLAILSFAGCEKEKNEVIQDGIIQDEHRKDYLVENISWFADSTNYHVSSYEYDSLFLLRRIETVGKIYEASQIKPLKYIVTFVYDDGLLSEIVETQYEPRYFQRPPIRFYYNLEGKVTSMDYYGNMVRFGYYHDRIDSVCYDSNQETYSILKYDNRGNVVRVISRVPEYDIVGLPTGRYRFQTTEYVYDLHSRPFFNLDGIPYQPIYGDGFFDNGIEISRLFSNNNLIRSGLWTWEYSYDTNGLPSTSYFQFGDDVPLNHPMNLFTYKKIR